MLLIDALRYSRAAACENTRMRACTNETDKAVANRQPCSVATGAHMRSVRFSAGADDILEPQNYSRGGESARAAQVAHSSEQTAHAQACLRDTSCPFWLHPAQRRLQRRDLTRAQPTNKCIEARGHSLGRAPTHTLDFALAVALALTSSPSRSHDSFSSSPSLSLSQWTTRVCTYVHAKHIHDTQ